MLCDTRIQKLADQIINYSINLKKGEKVLLDMIDTPESIVLALIKSTNKIGGIPFVNLNNSKISRQLIKNASNEQYKNRSEIALYEMKKMDAYVAIRASHNISEYSDIPSEKITLISEYMRPVIDHRVDKTKWSILRWPTEAMSQQAMMSTEAFEDYFFKVCLVDYKKMLPSMLKLKKIMEQTDQVHIKGNGTDLKFSIKDIPVIECCGMHNIPDGEVFTAPVKTTVNGEISYNTPTVYRSVSFDNIKLTFKDGKIIKASSSNGEKAINDILDADEGARYIGEFALGLNNEIKTPIRDILFDEKIGGSFHFTPGQSYKKADNGNRSQIHWDLVCIQTQEYGGGEIYFDNKLIRKDGLFVIDELRDLNP